VYHNGYLYCGAFNNKRIYQINVNTAISTQILSTGGRPFGLAIKDNYLYVSYTGTNIINYDISDLSITNDFYTNPLATDIYAITFDSLGNLYSLYNNSSIYYVNRIDSSGNVDLSFSYNDYVVNAEFLNIGLACDSNNTLYISNYDGNNIASYDSSGTRLNLAYINNGPYTYPRGIAFKDDFLYFIDTTNPETETLGGTVYKGVTASCYNFDTKILCLNDSLEEEYIPIQNLKSGDVVKTYLHGYQRIDLIGKISFTNNPSQWNQCMYKMEKTEENGLLEDLIVTGGHSILLDEFTESEKENLNKLGVKEYAYKIDDKYLLLVSASDKFIKLTGSNIYTCYHFVLETNGNDDKQFGIWANGILTETTSKNYFKTQNYTLL
jgi:hypothetical protein